MTKIKSHTDIEQSKQLAEILPIESADMYYHYTTGVKSYHEDAPKYVQVFNHFVFFHYDIPCWSLSALLNVLPSATIDSSDDHHYRVHCMKKYTEWHDNPIDACYEMILKLNELKLLQL